MNLRVLVARKQLDLTQEELATQAGITQPDMTLIEKHGWTPPAEIQQKIAKVLGATVDDLFSGDRDEVTT